MKNLSFTLLYIILALLFLGSCSSDDSGTRSDTGPDFSISELQGNWNATEISFSYSGQGTIPDPSFYAVVAEGGSGTLSVQANGDFTITITPAGQLAMTFEGFMYFEDGEFFAIQFDDDPPNDPTYFGAILTADTLTIIGGPGTATWDFDGDGNEEEANVNLIFERA